MPDPEWRPLTPALLRELAVEARTAEHERTWGVSLENVARRFEEAADEIDRLRKLVKHP